MSVTQFFHVKRYQVVSGWGLALLKSRLISQKASNCLTVQSRQHQVLSWHNALHQNFQDKDAIISVMIYMACQMNNKCSVWK